jgi:hypothetical protein
MALLTITENFQLLVNQVIDPETIENCSREVQAFHNGTAPYAGPQIDGISHFGLKSLRNASFAAGAVDAANITANTIRGEKINYNILTNNQLANASIYDRNIDWVNSHEGQPVKMFAPDGLVTRPQKIGYGKKALDLPIPLASATTVVLWGDPEWDCGDPNFTAPGVVIYVMPCYRLTGYAVASPRVCVVYTYDDLGITFKVTRGVEANDDDWTGFVEWVAIGL